MSNIRVNFSGFLSFGTGIVSMITGFVFTIIITRSLDIQEYGTWGLINSFLVYVLILHPIVAYWTTREITRGERPSRTSLLFGEILAVVAIVIYITIITLFGDASDALTEFLIFGIILIPVMFLRYILNSISLGTRPEIISYSSFLAELARLPSGIIFVYLFDMGILGVIISFLISHLVAVVFESIKTLPELKFRFNIDYIKKWIRFAWLPIFPEIGNLLNRSDVIIFSIITSSVAGVAYFTAASALAHIVSFAGNISFGIYPKLLASKERLFVQENILYQLYVSIPLIGVIISLARPILYVLNPIYEIVIFPVIFLVIRQLFINLNNVFYKILIGIETVDLDKQVSVKKFVKSKLFFIPLLRLVRYLVYVVLIILVLFSLKEESQILLVTYWTFVAMVIEIPFSFYLYSLVKKNSEIKLEYGRIVKYVTVAIPVCLTTYFLSGSIKYSPKLIDFIPQLLIPLAFTIIAYITITFFIDARAKKLIKSVIQKAIRK